VATVRTLTAYRELLRMTILEARGRVVDSPGDNVLAEFPSVIDARAIVSPPPPCHGLADGVFDRKVRNGAVKSTVLVD